jgi:diguanylate cyclase (GGDEF)-like protein
MTPSAGHDLLLIGTPSKVFIEGAAPMRVCHTVFEAIIEAQERPCEKVFVVYSELAEPKPQALDALHHAYPDSSVCLLVQMAEEPLVRQWFKTCSWASSQTEYVVCPVSVDSLMPWKQERDRDVAALSEMLKEKEQRIEQLEVLVMQDDLTGLKNRRYLKHFLPVIMRRAHANHGQVTLLLFDLDDFKHYNDSYGHSVGDDVLRQTAELIRRCCRNQDVVARLGGDEFAVIFWDVSGEEDSAELSPAEDRRASHQDHPRQVRFMAERFCMEMSEKSFNLLGEKGKGRLTISGGLATFPTDAQSAKELFEKADQAMLEAKKSGKNRVYLVGRPA